MNRRDLASWADDLVVPDSGTRSTHGRRREIERPLDNAHWASSHTAHAAKAAALFRDQGGNATS